MSQNTQGALASDPAVVIEVLQGALRASLRREHELKLQLEQKEGEVDIAKRRRTVQMEEEATTVNAAVPIVEFEAAAAHRENRPGTDGSNSVIAAALDCGARFCKKCAADPLTPVCIFLCAFLAVNDQSWMIRIMLLLLMFWFAISD